MKTLFLLRHAKSSSLDESVHDFDRPLNEKGLHAARDVGLFLRAELASAELLISSPALRAQQTTEIVLAESRLAPTVKFDNRVYEASVTNLVTVLNEVRAEVTTLVLVGHNPGMETLLQFLTGDRRGMPTAALAKITFRKNGWARLLPGDGHLEWLVTPKEMSHFTGR